MLEHEMSPISKRSDGKKYEPKEAYKDVWDRVLERALEIISENEGPEQDLERFERIKNVFSDESLRKTMTDVWTEQSMRGAVENDPVKQEELWARDLAASVINDKIDN